jgi:hypothetical protein
MHPPGRATSRTPVRGNGGATDARVASSSSPIGGTGAGWPPRRRSNPIVRISAGLVDWGDPDVANAIASFVSANMVIAIVRPTRTGRSLVAQALVRLVADRRPRATCPWLPRQPSGSGAARSKRHWRGAATTSTGTSTSPETRSSLPRGPTDHASAGSASPKYVLSSSAANVCCSNEGVLSVCSPRGPATSWRRCLVAGRSGS